MFDEDGRPYDAAAAARILNEECKRAGDKNNVLTLKKFYHFSESFDVVYAKLMNATTQAQKEKFEAELRKENKKLKRMWDVLKQWIGSSEVKDPSKLIDVRMLIETQMDKFKVVEQNRKALQKEGHGAAPKDPIIKESEELGEWVSDIITQLQIQEDLMECEVESIESGKRKKLDREKQKRLEELNGKLERHKYHLSKLETILRMLDNLSDDKKKLKRVMLQIHGIRPDVEYYIESSLEPDYIDNDYVYEDIEGFQEFDEGIARQNTVTKSKSTKSKAAASHEPEKSQTSQANRSGKNSPVPRVQHSRQNSRELQEKSLSKPGPSRKLYAPAPAPVPIPCKASNKKEFQGTFKESQGNYRDAVKNGLMPHPPKETTASLLAKYDQELSLGQSDQRLTDFTSQSISSDVERELISSFSKQLTFADESNDLGPPTPGSDINSIIKPNGFTQNELLTDFTFDLEAKSQLSPQQALPQEPPISTLAPLSSLPTLPRLPPLPAAALQPPLRASGFPVDLGASGLASTGMRKSLSSFTTSFPYGSSVHVDNGYNSITSNTLTSSGSSIKIPDCLEKNDYSNLHGMTSPKSDNFISMLNLSNNTDENFASFTAKSSPPIVNPMTATTTATIPASHPPGISVPFSAAHNNLNESFNFATESNQHVPPLNQNQYTLNDFFTKPELPQYGPNELENEIRRRPLRDYVKLEDPFLLNLPQGQGEAVASLKGTELLDQTGFTLGSDTKDTESDTWEAFIPTILSIAPMGKIPLTNEELFQLEMLEAAFTRMPLPSDSEPRKAFLRHTSTPTPDSYPQYPRQRDESLDDYMRLSSEALFFMFYYSEGSKAQFMAAQALKKKFWRYHTLFFMWYQRFDQPRIITDSFEIGNYVYFDFVSWNYGRRNDFMFEFKYLEGHEKAKKFQEVESQYLYY